MNQKTQVDWEMVIGLEVHVQLATETKLFCSCRNRFGDPPNTHVCPVCLGYPGALPVLQSAAVSAAVRAGLAFQCEIQKTSIFDRKNYFYPDLPKGYQISQFDRPYALGGRVEFDLAGDAHSVPLTRIHMEEDAGKSIHDRDVGTRIDLNRCGTPLLEMVTDPTIRSAKEASSFLRTVRDTMRWIGVSDANMEEGSLRCDVNLSLRPRGQLEYGTRTELKNLNSFTFVEQAIALESARQAEVLDGGEEIVQETRLFDPEQGRTASMRGKEEAHDYRYFGEPDIPPLTISSDLIETEKAELPELPFTRRRRYLSSYELNEKEATLLTSSRGLSTYFEGLLDLDLTPRSASNWLQSEVLRALKELGLEIEDYPIDPVGLVAVVKAVEAETLSVAAGRELLGRAAQERQDPRVLLESVEVQVSDAETLESWVDEVLSKHPQVEEQIRGGDLKPIGFLTGQVMKLSRGQANPKRVTELIKARFH